MSQATENAITEAGQSQVTSSQSAAPPTPLTLDEKLDKMMELFQILDQKVTNLQDGMYRDEEADQENTFGCRSRDHSRDRSRDRHRSRSHDRSSSCECRHDLSYSEDDRESSVQETLVKNPKRRPGDPIKSSKNKKPRKDEEVVSEFENEEAPDEGLDQKVLSVVQGYEETKPHHVEDFTRDPIPQLLADTLKTWMWQHYNSDEIQKLQEKARQPASKAIDAKY